jgi:MFS family permease
MRTTIDFLRAERPARFFFAALTQSAFGTGAGYVALLLLAYERFQSVWAISLVLLADLVPAMLFGPLLGAMADRWSRRACLVLADVIRAAAFVGIAVVHSFTATLAFALIAGVGTALFTPAALAALPNLTIPRNLPVATSLYGAITDLGRTVGPALAAGVLVIAGAEGVMALNAVTFAASGLILARIPFFDRRPPTVEPAAVDTRWRLALISDAAAGLRASFGSRPLRIVLLASTASLLCAGVFNVAELPFVTGELGVGGAGFALLVALFGAGVVVGSLIGTRGGDLPVLKRRYLTGLLLMAMSLAGIGLAFVVGTAVVAFIGAGFGNGLMLVHERLLLQTTVPDHMLGRVFGTKDALTAWAFALSFLVAPPFIQLLGTRTMLLVAASTALVAWLVSALALRKSWREPVPAPPQVGAPLAEPLGRGP